ncbi:MAG: cytochrome c3 family protein [Peptococcales bacterium]|jgi:predicted CXXCH cytochrome family protein
MPIYLNRFYIFTILIFLLILTMGCMKKGEQNLDQAVYVGSGKCTDCHREIKNHIGANPHWTAFKPWKDYKISIDQTRKIYTDDNEGNSRSYSLGETQIVGVMSDYYVVGKLDDKLYRVAAIKKENDKWQIEPAALKEINGQKEWVIRDYTCGKCHSPGLDRDTGFLTGEPGISCEICHGPGSIHVTTRAKNAIKPGQESCLNCHTSSEPGVKGEILIAQNHYGTRNWFDANHNSGNPADCLKCHTAHETNNEGKLLKKASTQEVCNSCHSREINADEIMWVNPTDAYGHFSKDHSFGRYRYEDYDDDPNTQELEIKNAETIKNMKSKLKNK